MYLIKKFKRLIQEQNDLKNDGVSIMAAPGSEISNQFFQHLLEIKKIKGLIV